jgi:hypothetical protein
MTLTVKKLVFSAGFLGLFLCLSNSAHAQKFFIGYGLSIYTDYAFVSPVEAVEDESSNTFGASFLSVSAEMKYNVHEFNSETALSIAASPRLGTMTFNNFDGFGNLSIPVYAQIDFGNLSTFDSKKDIGFGLGVGYQFDTYNLFSGEGFSVSSLALRGGFRYFNRNNKAREIALKYALPSTTEIETSFFNPITNESELIPVEFKVSTIQLTWILYFNY